MNLFHNLAILESLNQIIANMQDEIVSLKNRIRILEKQVSKSSGKRGRRRRK